MLGKDKSKYKAYVKLINKCLFHTLENIQMIKYHIIIQKS